LNDGAAAGAGAGAGALRGLLYSGSLPGPPSKYHRFSIYFIRMKSRNRLASELDVGKKSFELDFAKNFELHALFPPWVISFTSSNEKVVIEIPLTLN
jgi:hypothetical protein